VLTLQVIQFPAGFNICLVMKNFTRISTYW